MVTIWHWVVHFLGCDYGLPYGQWGWYNFWSGVGGSFLVNLLAFMILWWWHQTCHDHALCLRWGKYPMAGGLFRVCAKHHPDIDHTKPRRQEMHRLHREWRERVTS